MKTLKQLAGKIGSMTRERNEFIHTIGDLINENQDLKAERDQLKKSLENEKLMSGNKDESIESWKFIAEQWRGLRKAS